MSYTEIILKKREEIEDLRREIDELKREKLEYIYNNKVLTHRHLHSLDNVLVSEKRKLKSKEYNAVERAAITIYLNRYKYLSEEDVLKVYTLTRFINIKYKFINLK